jgi:hypothetical protein
MVQTYMASITPKQCHPERKHPKGFRMTREEANRRAGFHLYSALSSIPAKEVVGWVSDLLTQRVFNLKAYTS